MLPHPFKTDTWIEGERSNENNLCNEIPMPMSGNDICVLGMKPSMMKYMALNNEVHQTQVHGRVWHLIGDTNLKLINSSYSGSTPDQRMDTQEVLDLARELYAEHDPDFTELYNTLGKLRAIQFEERMKLFSSFATLQNLKEKGIMTTLTEQTDIVAKLTQAQPSGSDGGLHRGELVLQSASNVGKSAGTEELAKLISEAGNNGDHGPSEDQFVDLSRSARGKLKSLDGVRKVKRKKSKPKSNHLTNMNNARTKRVLGATILNMLGKVQQDTADSYKRSLLKEIPLADFVELASGEKLPDYQANLLNAMQAKADPSAPIVERVNAGTVPAIQEHVEIVNTMMGRGQTAPILIFDESPEQLSNEERLTIFEQNIDNALARYVTPDVFPEGTTDEMRVDVIAQVKAAVLNRNMAIDQQTLITEAMSLVHPLDTEAA